MSAKEDIDRYEVVVVFCRRCKWTKECGWDELEEAEQEGVAHWEAEHSKEPA